jgi:2'-hydroxyisoflavone reductase
MKLLILGGSLFLGRVLVESALQNGHEVTLFNRGQTQPELFPQVTKLRGDRRSGDLDALKVPAQRAATWDAVIDTSGYEPGVVRQSAELLANATGLYTFISSISVYAGLPVKGMDENAPLAQLPPGVDPDASVTGETYGAQKALCEQAAEAALPGRVLTIRPGLIVGPYDPSDRFTYWPWRVAQGGEVLAPGQPEYEVQFIDVRDLAEWTLRMVEAQHTGIFNATGPRSPLPMGSLLETCQQVSASDAHFTWVDEQFLLEHGAQPWMELPLWIPQSDAENAGMSAVSIQRALNAGLTFRPLADTVRATLAWAATRSPEHVWRAGLPREKESQLLAAYRQ